MAVDILGELDISLTWTRVKNELRGLFGVEPDAEEERRPLRQSALPIVT